MMVTQIIPKLSGFSPRTIVHVGAHLAEEIDDYQNFNPARIVWVEADPVLFKRMISHVNNKKRDGIRNICINALISDKDGDNLKFFHFTNNGASSSIFRSTSKLREAFPGVQETGREINLETRSLDSLVSEIKVPVNEIDVLVLDVQGAELLCLNGAQAILEHAKLVEVEVSREQIYDGAPLFEEIDRTLRSKGFFPCTPIPWHGDVVYANQKFISLKPAKSDSAPVEAEANQLAVHSFAYALQHQMSGRLDEAQKIYDSVLAQHPDQSAVRWAADLLRQQRVITACLAEARNKVAPFYLPRPDCQVPGLSQILEEAFGRKTDGAFVEIGAFDGQSYSNTEFLASLGWKGLYVEPVPEFFRKCVAWHRGNRAVDVVNCAIGVEEGDVEIHVGGALSTSLVGQRQHYESLAWAKNEFVNTYTVRTMKRRLEAVLVQYEVPKNFDLLVVDVEGMELDVFRSFDLGAWAPRMAIVELEDNHPSFRHLPEVVERCQVIRRLFADHGYRERHIDAINTVFLQG